MEQIGEGVYRLGSRWVNFYLVEDGGALTVVDTGYLGYRDQLDEALQGLGRQHSDVKAIVLTHAHTDHTGGVEDFATRTGAPVLAHRGEADYVTGRAKMSNPKGVVRSLWRPLLWSFVGHSAMSKGFAKVTVSDVTPFGDDDVLDVPGKPRVLFTPGHSVAHCALLFEGRRVLFCGDALATFAVDTGATGPMVHSFNLDRAGAVRSLDVLEKVDADVLLPGHGEPWRGPISEAVAIARSKERR